MFMSPYQTTPCKDYNLNMIVQAVVSERIEGALVPAGLLVQQVGPASREVPLFTQPLTRFEFGDRKNPPDLVIDARSYLKENRQRGGDALYVSSGDEQEFQMARALMQLFWQNENFSKLDLMRAGDLPGISFVNWVSRTIAGKLGFDPEQQMLLAVICAYYYICLFYDEREFDDTARTKSVQVIARWTRVPAERIFGVIDQLDYLRNIKEFVGAIHKVIVSTRTEHIEVGFLYSLLGGSWFASSRETVCVALEHPPTFIAMVKAALETRTYRNATLAKVVQMAVKGGNDKDFLHGLSFLLKGLN